MRNIRKFESIDPSFDCIKSEYGYGYDGHQNKNLTGEKCSVCKPRERASPRTKLLVLMSFAFVVIPWFSYLYVSEMEDFLVDSQANAQLLQLRELLSLTVALFL